MKISPKIFYNIYESDEIVEIDNFKFYFSSLFNKKRFLLKYKNFLKEEKAKLEKKYKYTIDIKEYLLIVFYKKVEKRGFYIEMYDETLNKYVKVK